MSILYYNFFIKKHILILLVAIFSIDSYTQIQFENGYYIDNSNQRIECQIKNSDWRNNPTEFEFRFSNDGKPQKANIESVKEFGVLGTMKYIRQNIDIDRSSN